GTAYVSGGDFRFLQIVFGYLVARLIISAVFMPWYFRGELVTVYQLLRERFGAPVRGLAATLFVVMRTIADGVRLLLTGLVVAAVFKSIGADTALDATVIGLGVVMIVFTLIGGIQAIVWIEVVQLLIYIGGAIAAAVILMQHVGAGEAIALAASYDKFRVFDFALDFTKTYGFWSGLIGGTFLTLSTHGTDQYMVQRYLCTDRPRKAATALLASGVIVLVQFVGFLFIGVLLFAFYRPDRLPAYAKLGSAAPFTAADQVFPDFITTQLPAGLSGLVVAAILAAAMSSSLSAIASTVVSDLYQPLAKQRDDRHYLRVSRAVVIVAGLAQIAVGIALQTQQRSAVNAVLSVASLINGPILGVFFLGMLKRGRTTAALAGMTVGLATVLYIAFATKVAWPWFAVVGSLVTVMVGLLVSAFENNELRTQI
ncbi:MAG TPA: hypothetical protein VF698_09935, partial [Thermoanaerobaculia bacterium]